MPPLSRPPSPLRHLHLQAVILADVDAHALYPLTNDLPKSLLPLLNRPLLQYQLDLLHASGKEGRVEEREGGRG